MGKAEDRDALNLFEDIRTAFAGRPARPARPVVQAKPDRPVGPTRGQFDAEAKKNFCIHCLGRPVVTMVKRATTAGKHVVDIEQWLCADCSNAIAAFLMPDRPTYSAENPSPLDQVLGRLAGKKDTPG